ncbi:hypothetical protein A3B02_02525 [Candidatus Roizmanbacteria bacterium RIFCSPLOWO2_01_FULL_42_14]|uniref:Uncharacterized protein n=2 Tax=Candidatus Roizmaniibacteriota TaxID=1752723 RepID=A0A1F7JW80_9BACT|nr:MAG: hypothetical protein A3B02_02525 [Candidatus Roizmanbacteria bacterium RIFCSPLOWO2_01_FULL_42_14]OGK59871.1 MAG: hypothetical protein A3I56_03315 [Candidatus Roizmanbacteria bacterium RIFCSPLOWO2_02_FULL_43_10]
MISKLSPYFKLKSAVTQFFIFLSCFALISFADMYLFSTRSERIHMFIVLAAIILTISGLVYIVHGILQRTELNPLHIAISGIIVFLIIHPTQSLILFVVALTLAVSSKLIRFRGQPILNPAATGIALTFYLSALARKSVFMSWWGADMVQNFTKGNVLVYYSLAVIFLGGFIYFAWKFNKSSYIASFVMTHLLFIFYTTLQTTGSSAETIAFIIASFFNSFAFLALVMIPEPKTSPSSPKQQVIVGIFGGIVLYMLLLDSVPFISSDLAFIHTVLATNVVTFVLKRWA